MAWHDNLEGPALDFAASNKSRIKCLAGPGTGKTYALMKRIQRLLEEGVDPSRILIITLTRTAADDLKRSLEQLEVEGASGIYTTTLHSFCFSALVREEILTVTNRVPRILAHFERKVLLKDLPDELGNFTQKERLLTEFEAAWSNAEGTPLNITPGSLQAKFLDQMLKSFKFHKCMLVEE